MQKVPFKESSSPLAGHNALVTTIDQAGQMNAAQAEDWVRYVITITRRPGMDRPLELIKAHVAHLRRLDGAGRLVLAGPFDDGAGGMVIIRAESAEEAEALAAADPFVQAGVYDYQVRKWHLSCEANKHMGIVE
ncbi:MAG TPA: YciI family protein [Symbiobacteriaceae bacterium]|nr:YciI family protein [Symbiobacteriaceae bacterium]